MKKHATNLNKHVQKQKRKRFNINFVKTLPLNKFLILKKDTPYCSVSFSFSKEGIV